MAHLAIRTALPQDIPQLRELIEASVRGLQAADYSPAQLTQALETVYGVDTALIADGTYFAVEAGGRIAGCGGWSRRKTLFGGDHFHGREDGLLDPAHDAAKIRAFFVHPDFARQGIGSLLLETSERAARNAGFTRFEMGATLTGVAFYRARGYQSGQAIHVPLSGGEVLEVVHMVKSVA